MLIEPFVVISSQSPLYPQLVHVLAFAACLSPLVFGTRIGIVIAVVWGVIFGLTRRPEAGPLGATIEGALIAVTVLTCVSAIYLFRKASDAVSSSAAAERSAAAVAARAALRLRERERWDLVLHDLVLGALILASRIGERNRTAAGQLARDSLQALDAETMSEAESLSSSLSQQSRRLGLNLTVDLDGDSHTSAWPRATWEAVVGAVSEALVNISRHSGQQGAHVRARLRADSAEITISDTGIGFDPESVDQSRAGVRKGIVGRMRTVGGEARIVAKPGLGVVVTIMWVGDDQQVVAPTDWSLRIFMPLATLSLCLLALHIAMGYGHLSYVANGCIAVALVILTVWVWWLPRASRWWPAAALALIALPVVVVIVLGLGLPADLRFWFGGAIGPAVAGLSFKYRPWSGVVVVVASVLVVAAAVSPVSQVPWGSAIFALLPAYGASFAASIGGALLQVALDNFSASINRDNAKLVELQIETDRREIRVAEIDRRQQALRETVIPMLRRIAAGDELSSSERDRCHIMEQTARDHLVAPSLIACAQVADAVLRARTRGVTVVLSDEDPESGDGFRRFQELLSAVVESVSSGAVVRARWRPRGELLGTIVIVRSSLADKDLIRWQSRGENGEATRLELSQDEDSILFELVGSET